MPSTEPPSVPLSFSNNFWGKDDAGVSPLLERMHNAKNTCDELKAFYSARAALEEEYAKKLLGLARRGLGSAESGTLRLSLDVVRAEVESMGKAHAQVAAQMKSELDEPLTAFAGAMKERRKIIQSGVEKLHKTKTAQTVTANKARDKYENDCLKVKGYLAQGHMVMGQEERKNKAKLEKTQIQMSSNSNEYEAAVKVLEETTGKWNIQWKAACDKFQDLEEERIDFLKSSLWTFANIASTVCVSDDASCEKMRLSLEDCDVEKDLMSFIKEKGTGQEIPDPPKFIDFCRGDADDSASEASRDDAYTVAQFPRAINPTIRSSSPAPSTFDSHNDPDPSASLAQQMGMAAKPSHPVASEPDPFRRSDRSERSIGSAKQPLYPDGRRSVRGDPFQQPNFNMSRSDFPEVPHDPHPQSGMTQFCRTKPFMPPPANRSAATSPERRGSRDSISDISNPSTFTSYGPSSGAQSPVKQMESQTQSSPIGDESPRKRGFFNSPFRRKSRHGRDLNSNASEHSSATVTPSSANQSAWNAPRNANYATESPSQYRGRNATYGRGGREPSMEPEPVDPRAKFQLNVGNNVFDVAPDARRPVSRATPQDSMEMDPIAQALEDLKGITKASSVRQTVDRYAGLATPAPQGSPLPGGRPTPLVDPNHRAAQRGTPPPSYDAPPVSRLGAPPAAHTARAMKETTKQFTTQAESVFGQSPHHQRTGTWSRKQGADMTRATSPGPPRAISPRPDMYSSSPQHGPGSGSAAAGYTRPPSSAGYGRPLSSMEYQNAGRPISPNPYAAGAAGAGAQRPRSSTAYGSQRGAPPIARAVSPQPHFGPGSASRPQSRAGAAPPQLGMGAMQLASPGGMDGYGSVRGRPGTAGGGAVGAGGYEVGRVRSKSVADPGRPKCLHYARAMYMYAAQIPEELGFAKGDMLAVLRHQDDGWWEAEVCGKEGKRGLVPSNYLQAC